MTKRVPENVEKLELHLKYLFEHKVNLRDRVITINKDIDAETFAFVDSAITELESYNRQAITIRICSDGGDVYSALAIVGRIKTARCKIITEGYGCVMSASTLILAAGKERRASKYLFFMHHESSYGVEGRHSVIKAEVDQKEKEEKLWAKWMEELTKRQSKFWLERGKFIDEYWTAEELVEMGVVDAII